MKQLALLPFSLLALLWLSSCGNYLQRTELYFGMARPDGSVVSQQDWQAFVDEQLTPRFPEGLSVFEVQGQWRMNDGEIVREPSRVVLLLHEKDKEVKAQLDSLIDVYTQRFDQEAVMRLTSKTRVAFEN
jgi:hypothetical protein